MHILTKSRRTFYELQDILQCNAISFLLRQLLNMQQNHLKNWIRHDFCQLDNMTKMRLVFMFNNALRITYAFISIPQFQPQYPVYLMKHSVELDCLVIKK